MILSNDKQTKRKIASFFFLLQMFWSNIHVMRNDLKSDVNNKKAINQPASQSANQFEQQHHTFVFTKAFSTWNFLFQLQCKLIIITFNDRKQLFSTFFQHFNEPYMQLDEKQKILYPQHVWDSVSIAKINKLWTISLITNICDCVLREWTRHRITVNFPRAHKQMWNARTHTIFRFLACFCPHWNWCT